MKQNLKQNHIVHQLRQREIVPSSRGRHFQQSRRFYSSVVVPNHTIYNVIAPGRVFRKFTPDGKYLIAFAQQFRSVVVYKYLGPSPGNLPDDIAPNENVLAFFLKLHYERILSPENVVICKDFCLFTRNQDKMILVTAVPSTAPESHQEYPHSLNSIVMLDDITFWVFDIQTGNVLGQKTFQKEYMFLTNQSGVHLFDDYLAIASVQNQSIYICVIRPDGSLVQLQTIGWNLFEDDELFQTQCMQYETDFLQRVAIKKRRLDGREMGIESSVSQSHESADVEMSAVEQVIEEPQRPLSGLMQRILAFLFRRAKKAGTIQAINHFHLTFTYFESLILWRVQFLDNERLLIKLGNRENIIGKNSEPSITQTSFFVIYSYKTAVVNAVYDNSSTEFLELTKTFEPMLGNIPHDSSIFISGAGNNTFALDLMNTHMYAVQKARNGGPSQAVKRVVSGYPYNPQSFSETPYFDHSLFSWDDKLINSYDRARPCSEFPVKFYCRQTGRLKFKIDPHATPYGSNPTAPPYRSSKYILIVASQNLRKCVCYIFHPTDPFCISIQYVPSQSSTINLHIRRGQ